MRWALSALVLALAGCAALPLTWPPGQPDGAEPATAPAPSAAAYLGMLQAFANADAAARAQRYSEAVAALALDRTADNRLRLALLQGWPGHADSRPGRALERLEQMTDDDALPDDARTLVHVMHALFAEWHGQRQAHTGRIASLEDQVRAAEEKLAELAAIERLTDPDPCINAENDDDCPRTRPNPAR